MREYRAIILDLDGTVVESRPDAMPSDEVVSAVNEARDNEAVVSVATGRPFWMARQIINRLGIIEYCVVNGGPEIYHPYTEQPALLDPLTPDSQREAISIIQGMGFPVYDSANQFRGRPISARNLPAPNNPKLLVEALDAVDAEVLIRELESQVEEVAPHAATSWSKPGAVDIHITPAGATKADGVATLIDMLDIPPGQVIVVGDNDNDIPMFESGVGLSVAMGNAPDKVKEKADYVAPSLAENGVAVVIRNFILNKSGVRIRSVR